MLLNHLWLELDHGMSLSSKARLPVLPSFKKDQSDSRSVYDFLQEFEVALEGNQSDRSVGDWLYAHVCLHKL
jgi:hypothetical protein